MSLDSALADAMKSVPDCIASAYIDMDAGVLLASQTVDQQPQDFLDIVAAATSDIFQGENIVAIEDHFKGERGDDDKDRPYFKEYLVFSDEHMHAFLRTKKYPNHIIAYVCRNSGNVGMILLKSRATVEPLQNAV